MDSKKWITQNMQLLAEGRIKIKEEVLQKDNSHRKSYKMQCWKYQKLLHWKMIRKRKIPSYEI